LEIALKQYDDHLIKLGKEIAAEPPKSTQPEPSTDTQVVDALKLMLKLNN